MIKDVLELLVLLIGGALMALGFMIAGLVPEREPPWYAGGFALVLADVEIVDAAIAQQVRARATS